MAGVGGTPPSPPKSTFRSKHKKEKAIRAVRKRRPNRQKGGDEADLRTNGWETNEVTSDEWLFPSISATEAVPVPIVRHEPFGLVDEFKTAELGDHDAFCPLEAHLVEMEDMPSRRVDEEMPQRFRERLNQRLAEEPEKKIIAEIVPMDPPRKLWHQHVVLALVVVILMIALALGLSLGIRAPRPSKHTTANPFASPFTAPPGASSENSSRSVLIQSALETLLNSSTLEVDHGNSTPQNDAYVWILNEDTYDIQSLTSNQIVERYALAVFYFSTKGKEWRNQSSFLEPISVCEWNGNQTHTSNVDTYLPPHEALGISCNPNKTSVTSIRLSKSTPQQQQKPTQIGSKLNHSQENIPTC